MKYSLETVYRVWNDKTGDRIEIGPDNDGLDLVDIRYVDENGKVGNSVIMTREQATLVRDALSRMVD